MAKDENLPLFATKLAKGRILFQFYSLLIFVGICFIFAYRLSHIPAKGEPGRWAWMGLFFSELWFCFYWFVTTVVRWNPIYRNTFKDRLSHRYEKVLPSIDIFVCTADPVIEPPVMVINTVLSVMAYDYPPEKLSVYLSDDGGSDLTFYAMLEASRFSKIWLPFCKKFKVEPRSPEAYFRTAVEPLGEPVMAKEWSTVKLYSITGRYILVYLSDDGGSDLTFYAMLEASRFSKIWLPFCKKFKVEPRSPEAYFRTAVEPLGEPVMAKEWSTVKMLYEEMKKRIENTTKLGQISEEISKAHKGFNEWIFVSSRCHHQTILQILIDGREFEAMDIQGQTLPTLVYLSREKRPQYHHHFKAGAMNALIRVSSRISNSPIILNVDCDMYSNNSMSIRDALCFFMDEEKGNEVGFVQFPQAFENLTKNDVYSSSLNVLMELEMPGFDGNGGPCYFGTGCFHRRETLSGQEYSKIYNADWKRWRNRSVEDSTSVLEETCKVLASCSYEENTQWGKEMGLKYDCAVEDVLTGIAVQCRGWRSIYFTPERKGFLGLAPTTLLQSLVQHKRWSEGDFHIFASRHCPFVLGYKKIPLKLQLTYCMNLLWAANCLATLYYVIVPSLCLLRGISLFPEITNSWVLAFVFVIIVHRAYSLGEFVWFGGTFKGWWNDQRMWLYKRTTSYFFGFLDYILKRLGFTNSTFVITTKVADDNVSQRYEQEVMEFGTTSQMFTILATLALLNAICFVSGLKWVIADVETLVREQFALQILLCGLLVFINLPIYQGLFFRKDVASLPTSVTYQSTMFALLACAIAVY
nr:cellulose synthase-like protein e6 [Quercus suber]